ncbi:MAG: hypothetical protein BZY80_02840 [SAR202 cluster bacterium Io17-Chloro-G2]|nr:MAG: hypothetical protein BZY80_02840 [SAR202 cluster bacterium Io17-Chloro-G2]
MAKISITLPNITEISLEAEDASEMRQMVGLFKSDLLSELVQLPPAGTQIKDVPEHPDKDNSVPANGAGHTPDINPVSDRKTRGGSPAQQDIPEAAPPPPAAEPTTKEPSGQNPSVQDPPTAAGSNGGQPSPENTPSPSIPAQFSDPRLGHDFTVFCRTVNPMGDMRKVVAAAEGAARMFSMENVDAWELGHLFDTAGWSQPHSFTQALRNAARSKFRWLERVPGRSGRYSVTDAGRAVVLKGTNLL